MFQKVEEFNKTVIGIDRDINHLLATDEFEWLIGALHEECDELEEAFQKSDKVGQVDALIDLIYFACGGLTRMGVDHVKSEKIFSLVHSCNMEKDKGAKKERAIQLELDAIKPEDWESPEKRIKEILGL